MKLRNHGRFIKILTLALMWLCRGELASAQSLPLDPSNFDISGIDPALIARLKAGDMSAINEIKSTTAVPTITLPKTVTNGVIFSAGLAMDQKTLEPATPLGTNFGINLGAVVTLVKLPEDFATSLNTMGLKAGSNLPPAIPTAGLVIQKGLGDIDIGGSYIKLKDLLKIWSVNFKWAFYQPPEGMTWAFRFGYTNSKIMVINTKTFSPQLLMSRELMFADPYIGIGGQYVTGTIELDLPTGLPDSAIALGAPKTIKVKGEGSGWTGNAFTGVRFKIPKVGLLIGLEGSYSLAKAHTLSVKIGLGF